MKKKIVYIVAAVICLAVAILAAGFLLFKNIRERRAEEEYEALLEQMKTVMVSPEAEKTEEVAQETEEVAEEEVDLSIYDIPEKEIDFDVLCEENEDIYAWITVPDTNGDRAVYR